MNRGHVPFRKCTGCMTSKPKSELVRIGILENSADKNKSRVVVDETTQLKGRGAYLCKNKDCFQSAMKRRTINRTLKREVSQLDYERIGEFFEKF